MRAPWISTALVVLCIVAALSRNACAEPGYCCEPSRSCALCHSGPPRSPVPTSSGREYMRSPDRLAPSSEFSTPAAADRSSGGTTGLIAIGFGLTSFCLLAYRKSR